MFCPKCGNSVSKGDNYCAVCGKNLKNVRINIESLEHSDKEDTKKLNNLKTSDETKVFKPINIDKIDSTDEIKKIIEEVDKKISQNIKDYEDKVSLEQEIIKHENDKISNEDDFFDDEPKSSFSEKMTQKELIKRVQEELKKSNFSEDDLDSIDEKNLKSDKSDKKSLKDIWKNFINEDNDEFSIFSNLKKDKSKQTTLERDFDIAQNTNTDFADDTYSSIPISQITEIVREKEKESLKKSQDDSKIENKKEFKEISKEENPKENKISKLFNFSKNKNIDLSKEIVSEKEKLKKEFKDSKEKLASLDKKDSPSKYAYVYKLMDLVSIYTSSLKSFVKDTSSREFNIIFLFSIILTILQIFIGQSSFKILQFIILVVLKILFDIITFYIPLNVTTDRAWINSSDEEVRTFAIINYFLCKVFLFIAFIISPFGGMFEYNLISALTAMPLATIFLFFISIIIALSFYWKELRDKNKVEFLGWYIITFVLLELGFKLFWFFINFIFNTLF